MERGRTERQQILELRWRSTHAMQCAQRLPAAHHAKSPVEDRRFAE
jgi:hypothetical protein